MDSVSRRIIASLFTDSLDPDPFSPLLMSVRTGLQPNRVVKILGPAAPILPSTSAPPIQRKNGPKRNNSPSTMKFELIPSSLIGPKPPLLSIQLSRNERIPTKNIIRCSQSLDFFLMETLLTPSSISMLRKSLVLELPNNRVSPTVTVNISRVTSPLRVGTTLKSLLSNAMNPTASRTTGTEAIAKR